MRILKFGGKSLSTKEKMQKICKYIKKIYKNDKKIIVVVSAMGNSTDKLLDLASDFVGTKTTSRELATLLSTGETVSSSIFAMMLNSMGVPAKSIQGFELQITTYGEHTNSRIAYLNKTILENVMSNDTVAVVSGFQGINSKGEITTLGRGGSDTTAAAIGAVFNQTPEIYSDFNGVFTGDPRELDFKKLKEVGYDEMIAMAEGGAKVIDSRASSIAKEYEIDLISKSSSQPEKSGTTISSLERDIISLAIIDKLTKVTIVVTNPERFEKVVKSVILCINKNKFYNFSANLNKISFLIYSSDKTKILTELANKLNLVKK